MWGSDTIPCTPPTEVPVPRNYRYSPLPHQLEGRGRSGARHMICLWLAVLWFGGSMTEQQFISLYLQDHRTYIKLLPGNLPVYRYRHTYTHRHLLWIECTAPHRARCGSIFLIKPRSPHLPAGRSSTREGIAPIQMIQSNMLSYITIQDHPTNKRA